MSVGEWDQRQLCPDGACIGVIGADGQCKVCGRVAPNWGDERNRGLIVSTPFGEDAEDAVDEELDEQRAAATPADATDADAPAEWSNRKLCPDGACIGVIGGDGICTVCGKRADADGEAKA